MDIKQKRRYIYSLGRKCGLVDDGNKSDDLHGFVYQLTLKESISELNDEQADIVIKQLQANLRAITPEVKAYISNAQIEHLTGTQAEIAEVIGIEAYRKLVGYFGGERIAVAKPSTLINFAVARNIAEENNYSEEVMTALELSKKEQEKIIAGLK